MNHQTIILFHHFRELLYDANAAGISIAPLKGAELMTSVYPPNEDRGLLADIDFLVQDKDFDAACLLLEQRGFVRRSFPGRLFTKTKLKDAGYYLHITAKISILFEVHRYFIQKERHPINYDEIWQRASDSYFEDAPCKRLCPEDTFLHIIIHLLTDRFTELNRPLRDLELLMKNQNLDFPTIVQRAVEWKCSRALWLSLRLLKQHRNARIPENTIRQLSPPPLVETLLNFLIPDIHGFRFQRLNLRGQQFLLWPILMDNANQAISFGTYYSYLRVKDILASMDQRKID
jgi:hypothetical protein